MPTNSWNNNIHLFVKELKETEIDLISKFYSNATYLDNLINKISDLRNQNYSLLKIPLKHIKLPELELYEYLLEGVSIEEKISQIKSRNLDSGISTLEKGEKIPGIDISDVNVNIHYSIEELQRRRLENDALVFKGHHFTGQASSAFSKNIILKELGIKPPF